MQIFHPLCLIGEYRDFYEDILTKIGEPLEEAGLTLDEINTFMSSCSYLLDFPPDGFRDRRSSSVDVRQGGRSASSLLSPTIRSEWIRYVECCRLCLMQLLKS
jgi:hypothetical protein